MARNGLAGTAGPSLQEYDFLRSQGYALESVWPMLGIRRHSLVNLLRRHGRRVVSRDGVFYDDPKIQSNSATHRPAWETVAMFEALQPPQGFRAAEVALEFGVAKKSLLETLRAQGYILKPIGGRGPGANKALVGHYIWERTVD